MFPVKHEVVLVKDFLCHVTYQCQIDIRNMDRSYVFPVGHLNFEDTHLAKLDGWSFKEKRIFDLLQANHRPGEDGKSPKVMSIWIGLNKDSLQYTLAVNKQFNQCLYGISNTASFQLNGSMKIEEQNNQGQWINWESKETNQFATSIEIKRYKQIDVLYIILDAAAAAPETQTYIIFKSAPDSTDFEAIQLILMLTRQLRISINLDVILQWESMDQMLPPLKLDVPEITKQDGPQEIAKITVDGKVVAKCPKAILEAKGNFFVGLLNPGMKKSASGTVPIRGFSQFTVQLLISCLIGGQIPPERLDCWEVMELFRAADQYKIPDLQSYCVSFMLSKNEEWYSGDNILKFHRFLEGLGRFHSLQKHLLRLMGRMRSEMLRECDAFQEQNSSDREDLMWNIIDSK